ncbi:MAG TPA: hypothetical protein VGK38_12675 [Prolixibacteraceae bacterium]
MTRKGDKAIERNGDGAMGRRGDKKGKQTTIFYNTFISQLILD